MNFLMNEYQQHYIEAHNSANEAIKQLKRFAEHITQLSENDKKQLLQQVMTEQVVPDWFQSIINCILYGTPN